MENELKEENQVPIEQPVVENKEPEVTTQKPKKKNKLLLILIPIVLIILIVIFILNMSKDPRKYLTDSIKDVIDYNKVITKPLKIKAKEYEVGKYQLKQNFEGSKIINNVDDKDMALTVDAIFNILKNNSNELTAEIDTKKEDMTINLTSFLNKKDFLNVDFAIKEEKAYFAIKEAINRYIELDTEDINTDIELDGYEDYMYLVDFIADRLPKHVSEKDFIETKETIKIDGKDLNTIKYDLKVNEEYLINLLKKVAKDIKKDKKADKAMLTIDKDYIKSFEDLKSTTEEAITYTMFVNKNKVVRTDIVLPINSYSGTKDNYKISFISGKIKTITLGINDETSIKLEFEETKTGYKVEIKLKEVTVFNMEVSNKNKVMTVKLKTSAIAEYDGFQINLTSSTDYNDESNIKSTEEMAVNISYIGEELSFVLKNESTITAVEIDKVEIDLSNTTTLEELTSEENEAMNQYLMTVVEKIIDAMGITIPTDGY